MTTAIKPKRDDAAAIAQQIASLSGFERLRHDRPLTQKSKKWDSQLNGLCEKVVQLVDQIAYGAYIPPELARRVEQRLADCAKSCTQEDRRHIKEAQRVFKNPAYVSSWKNDSFEPQESLSPICMEPLPFSYREGWLSACMHALLFQSVFKWPMLESSAALPTSAIVPLANTSTAAMQLTGLPATLAQPMGRFDQKKRELLGQKYSPTSAIAPLAHTQTAAMKSTELLTALAQPMGRFNQKGELPRQKHSLVASRSIWSTVADICSTVTKPFESLYAYWFPTSRDCLTPDCPDLNPKKLHPRELEAIEVVPVGGFFNHFRLLETEQEEKRRLFKTKQEWLRFRKDDLREKLLFVSADYDHNGALAPRWISNIIKVLDPEWDVKYKVVSSYQEICEEIKQVARIGKLAHVFINGHGNPEEICLYAYNLLGMPPLGCDSISSEQRIDIDFSDCFSNLKLSGRIVLLSCSVGGKRFFYDNLAQEMATGAKRAIIAATDEVYAPLTTIVSKNPLMLEHLRGFYNVSSDNGPEKKNISTRFETFYPRFSSCPDTVKRPSMLHPREQAAMNAVSTNLVARKILSSPASFVDMQEYFRLCKDDPREKFLFLSAQEDHNGAMNPQGYPGLLVDLSEHFDLKFKVVKSYRDICAEALAATKVGKVAAVLIHVHGQPDHLEIQNSSSFWSRIGLFENKEQFLGCLSKIPTSARIILAGGSTASSSTSLAYTIARETQRTVIAPTRPVYANRITLQSDPLMLYHPTIRSLLPDSSTNVFVTVEPPQNNTLRT